MITDPEIYANAVEGHLLPMAEFGEPMLCDFCSEEIEQNEEVTVYCTDIDYSRDEIQGAGYPARVYCSECNRRLVHFPTTKANEIMLDGVVRYEQQKPHFHEVSVIDVSYVDEGIPWDPSDVFGQLTPNVGLREFAREMASGDGEGVAPEDVVDQLRVAGIDIADIIGVDGEFTISRKERKEIREEFAENMMDGHKNMFGPPP